MSKRSDSFTTNFLSIRETVAETFMAQLEEYTTVVDDKANVGIDDRIVKQIKELESSIDSIMVQIDNTKNEAQYFFDQYIKELDTNEAKDKHLKQQGQKGEYMRKSAENAKHELTKELIEDVKFGAE